MEKAREKNHKNGRKRDDDVLFGEVWNREDKFYLRDRSLVTVVSLMSQGLVDSDGFNSGAIWLTNGREPGICSVCRSPYIELEMA